MVVIEEGPLVWIMGHPPCEVIALWLYKINTRGGPPFFWVLTDGGILVPVECTYSKYCISNAPHPRRAPCERIPLKNYFRSFWNNLLYIDISFKINFEKIIFEKKLVKK